MTGVAYRSASGRIECSQQRGHERRNRERTPGDPSDGAYTGSWRVLISPADSVIDLELILARLKRRRISDGWAANLQQDSVIPTLSRVDYLLGTSSRDITHGTFDTEQLWDALDRLADVVLWETRTPSLFPWDFFLWDSNSLEINFKPYGSILRLNLFGLFYFLWHRWLTLMACGTKLLQDIDKILIN